MNLPVPRLPDPLVSVDTNRKGLQCRFIWHGDRFAHVIESMDGDELGWQLSSVESASNDVWPLSPPTQQLSVELIGNSLVALGVGACGSGHWSVSISTGMFEGRPALIFDQAVRSMTPPENCGSVYQRHGDLLAIEVPSSAVPTKVDQIADGHHIRPASVDQWTSPSPRGETTRWCYTVVRL